MSTTIPACFTQATILPLFPQRGRHTTPCPRLSIKAHSLRDEGRSSKLVDSNMKVLKDRIEVIRTKERLETNCRPCGWDYTSNYVRKSSKQQQPEEYLRTMALMCGTMSFPILIGTTLLYIFSATAHLNL